MHCCGEFWGGAEACEGGGLNLGGEDGGRWGGVVGWEGGEGVAM